MNAPAILIAVPAEGGVERAAAAAVAVFGPDARYRFAHVAEPVPMTPPMTAGPAGFAPVGLAPADIAHMSVTERDEMLASSKAVATRAAEEAGLPDAETVGLYGDPAEAVIDEAVRCGASVIVITAHHRGWLDSMLHHSVSRDLEKESPVPLLVVPAAG